ncbi:hypothetical protein M9H77_17178 [Catharanthus roseus]|uniref:Uncharacterized protein n=1 Tax=Catharanthus roseus TaxID=4058 RepID=A0ACC0B3U0_CATRO|nr:hypothetical protein M9H77_17178 [Catharanthus roseus]
MGTTSRPLSYNNLKLPLLCGTFGHYDYKAWEQKVESLFYSYKCENRKRMRALPIKTCTLIKQSLRNRFGVGNHKGLRQDQPKVKFMELLKVEESPKSVQKRKKVSLRKERVKENECFIEKQESEKEENREKEIVVLEKSEEVNFYANEANSFFASKSLCVQNFEDSERMKKESLLQVHQDHKFLSLYFLLEL